MSTYMCCRCCPMYFFLGYFLFLWRKFISVINIVKRLKLIIHISVRMVIIWWIKGLLLLIFNYKVSISTFHISQYHTLITFSRMQAWPDIFSSYIYQYVLRKRHFNYSWVRNRCPPATKFTLKIYFEKTDT